ncbi:hypothetical protein F4775DRAFT_547311 [Biscogniauxia sp. FL1348]|nr:hypothetical protein F4775DRAFT_547311 [Biscogniauxia sp. FL1348]
MTREPGDKHTKHPSSFLFLSFGIQHDFEYQKGEGEALVRPPPGDLSRSLPIHTSPFAPQCLLRIWALHPARRDVPLYEHPAYKKIKKKKKKNPAQPLVLGIRGTEPTPQLYEAIRDSKTAYDSQPSYSLVQKTQDNEGSLLILKQNVEPHTNFCLKEKELIAYIYTSPLSPQHHSCSWIYKDIGIGKYRDTTERREETPQVSPDPSVDIDKRGSPDHPSFFFIHARVSYLQWEKIKNVQFWFCAASVKIKNV